MALWTAWSLSRNGKALVSAPTAAAHAAPLDGLRALAVLWVLAYHALVVMPYLLGLDDADRAVYWAFVGTFPMRPLALGDFGVDIFFILSGCLIMAIHGREMAAALAAAADPAATPLLAASNSIQDPTLEAALPVLAPARATTEQRPPTVARTVLHFFIRRYTRLMPAYAVALAYVMIKAAVEGTVATSCVPNIWRNFLFINNLFASGGCMPWSWSIAIEWQMYMVSPLIVWAVLRWPRWSRPLLGGLAALSMALYMGLTVRTFYTDHSFQDTVYSMPYTRVFAYFFGMAVTVEIDRKKAEARASPEKDVAPLTPTRIVFRILSIAAALAGAYHASDTGSLAWQRAQTVLVRPGFVVGMAYIVYDALLPRRPGTDRYQRAVNWLLGSRPLYFIAQVSYGVYLYHLFFADIYTLLKEPIASGSVAFVPQWIFPVFALFMLVLAVAASVVVYFLVEKPANNLAADLLKGPRKTGG